MSEKDLKQRTKAFTIRILDLVDKLPFSTVNKVIANQLARSGSSVGANYRASLRARSDNEFLSKMNIVLEEADETLFWLEIIDEKGIIENKEIQPLIKEANELVAIFVTTIKNTRTRLNN